MYSCNHTPAHFLCARRLYRLSPALAWPVFRTPLHRFIITLHHQRPRSLLISNCLFSCRVPWLCIKTAVDSCRLCNAIPMEMVSSHNLLLKVLQLFVLLAGLTSYTEGRSLKCSSAKPCSDRTPVIISKFLGYMSLTIRWGSKCRMILIASTSDRMWQTVFYRL